MSSSRDWIGQRLLKADSREGISVATATEREAKLIDAGSGPMKVLLTREVAEEPPRSETGDRVEGPELLKEMCRAGHDLEFAFATKAGLGVTVEFDHDVVAATDDKQCR